MCAETLSGREETLSPEDLEQAEKLPELRLKQILRSEEPVAEGQNVGRRTETVIPWNDYTIVMVEGKDEIQVYDREGKKIEDFLSGKTNFRINWEEVKNKTGKCNIVHNEKISGYNEREDICIGDLPQKIRVVVDNYLKNKDWIGIVEMVGIKFLFEGLSYLEVIKDGKYIVFFDRKGEYIAFCTQGESGKNLFPRNWERFDVSTCLEKKIPEDLKAYFEQKEKYFKLNKEKKSKGVKKLNERYLAIISDDKIVFIRSDDSEYKPVYTDNLLGKKQIFADPNNPDIIYFHATNNPRELYKLDTKGDPASWQVEAMPFNKNFAPATARDLKIDPTDNFYVYQEEDNLVVLEKDTLKAIKKFSGLYSATFDSYGNIRAIDKDGHLVILETNFAEIGKKIEEKKAANLAQGLDISNLFQPGVKIKVGAKEEEEDYEYLKMLKSQLEGKFREQLDTVTGLEQLPVIKEAFDKLRVELLNKGLKEKAVSFITDGIREIIQEKEKELIIMEANNVIARVQSKFDSGLSVSAISSIRDDLAKIDPYETLLEGDVKNKWQEIKIKFTEQSSELFRQRGAEIIKDVEGLIKGTEEELKRFTSKSQMDDWLEYRYPMLRSNLGSLMRGCPVEANDAYQAIAKVNNKLRDLANSYEEKFKNEYAKIREKAVERVEALTDSLKLDINGFLDRLREKGFTDRVMAERYIQNSEAKKTIEGDIIILSTQNPEASRELKRYLQVGLSNILATIERGAQVQVEETGQQMVMFGETAFPMWEAKVKEREKRQMELIFEEDLKSHGPGVEARYIQGDLVIYIKNSDGTKTKVNLWGDREDMEELRLGLKEGLPPSYLYADEFKKVKKGYTDWLKDEKSKLHTQFEEQREGLRKLRKQKQSLGENYQAKFDQAMKEYMKFYTDNYLGIYRRLDRLKQEPDIEHTNGKGYVPQWQSHWVVDSKTEHDLERMAEAFKMQLDLQEGLLDLKGHAGSGKDVLIKMFCAMDRRPYFAIDCTKWTTEFELSEDIVLEAEGGASRTVKVPSTVLNGITTPGAMVYFNEFTAMPEQAQIFLHALMDEKRSLTLKTSSGKEVRVLPTVLLAASENPDYPGTFKPQFATRSRMVSLDIGYPSLTRKPEKGDANPNPLYDASEALRIARGVDSLADLTYEANLEHNEFVKMWDKYVNGLENGVPDPNSTQKFDIDTILTLVQFANKLREDFTKIFEKSREARQALPVTQPLTGRELRRCAYDLSKMTPEEKATANSEEIARGLLKKYFLTHFDKTEDRTKIEAAMKGWTSKKRVRV